MHIIVSFVFVSLLGLVVLHFIVYLPRLPWVVMMLFESLLGDGLLLKLEGDARVRIGLDLQEAKWQLQESLRVYFLSPKQPSSIVDTVNQSPFRRIDAYHSIAY